MPTTTTRTRRKPAPNPVADALLEEALADQPEQQPWTPTLMLPDNPDAYRVPGDEAFERVSKIRTALGTQEEVTVHAEYAPAPGLRALADAIVQDRPHEYPQLHLDRIRFRWKRETTGEQGGAKAVKDLLRDAWQDTDFVVWLAADTLVGSEPIEIERVLAHWLLCLAYTGKGKPVIVAPPIQLHPEIAEHYGLDWMDDLIRLKRVAQQLPLDLAPLPDTHEGED